MSSVSNAVAASQYEVTIAKKQLDSVEQEGQNALALIEAASPPPSGPPANAAAGVGALLNVVA